MSIHAVAETSLATTDAQVIADMAAAVLASVARMHADGLATVAALAEAPVPVRLDLPPVAEAAAAVEEPARTEPTDDVLADDAPAEADDVEPVEEIVARAAEAGVEDDEPVVRIAEPVRIVPAPRGRHLAEALTDQLPAQHAA